MMSSSLISREIYIPPSTTVEPDKKRQKLNNFNYNMSTKMSTTSTNNSNMSHNVNSGTFTPITQSNSCESITNLHKNHDIEMLDEDHFEKKQNYGQMQSMSYLKINDKDTTECPCGYLHPRGAHEDIHAVGLAEVPLLRGPE
ncbi:unnamed protein product [Candida verbasci]|uniref:Uncharacterized protein n=1 Tax=Candida verbasci TaxID=1227364 RepID=A0A9W4TRZ8_9ASCO|nr:unnamed protein product [Candida verbasci]